LIAPRVGHVTGIDLSPSAIRAANRSAGQRGLSNTRFLEGSWPALPLEVGTFDDIIAVFFLHHLSAPAVASFPLQMQPLLRAGGRSYALEPSARRLSGFLGKLLVPNLMKKYQTANERQLLPASTTASFRDAGLVATTRWFDFCSTPFAGLFPSWPSG
jgi:SAM-dependent methyltransferase